MRSLVDFRARLTGGGVRPNLFRVFMKFPVLSNPGYADDLIPFLVESSSLPLDKIGEIEVPYMGRKTYYPGDRTFDPWSINVICDENFAIRDAFERWMSGINSHLGNLRDPLAAVPTGYETDPVIQQLSKIDGPPIKQYKMVGAFPTDLAAVEVDYGVNDTIAKFQVTLRYQWWEATGLATGATTDGTGIPSLG